MKTGINLFRLLFFGIILSVVVILSAPLYYGYKNTPLGKKFLGVTGLYPIEQFYYMSVGPSQAIKGDVIFADKYGRIDDEKILINPIANIIALISWISGASLPIAFNIFRILSGLLLIFSFHYLAKQFISSPYILLFAISIYSFSSGFDFIIQTLKIDGIDAVDDSIPEANMFIAMSGEYYLPLANALFILVMASSYKLFYKEENGIFLCGFSLFLLGTVYIYGLVSAVIIISISALYKGYSQKRIAATFFTLFKLSLFCLPIVSYYLWLIFRFPAIDNDGWFSFPTFLSFIATFGFGFLFTIIGLFLKDRLAVLKETYLLIWVLITILLVYLPQTILPIQIQMLVGFGAPLAIMFATTLQSVDKFLSIKLAIFSKQTVKLVSINIALFIILFSSLTNLKFYVQQFNNLEKQILPWYIDKELYNGMVWASENIQDRSSVIVSRELGFIFSSITACKVYVGIAPNHETTKEQNTTALFLSLVRANKIAEASNLINSIKADYLFFEKSLINSNFDEYGEILKANYKICFTNKDVLIVKFN